MKGSLWICILSIVIALGYCDRIIIDNNGSIENVDENDVDVGRCFMHTHIPHLNI